MGECSGKSVQGGLTDFPLNRIELERAPDAAILRRNSAQNEPFAIIRRLKCRNKNSMGREVYEADLIAENLNWAIRSGPIEDFGRIRIAIH
jgi:hypothetical protein